MPPKRWSGCTTKRIEGAPEGAPSALRRAAEHVADAADRVDVRRLARVRFDLASEPVDVDVHGACLTTVVVAPDTFQKLIAGERLARVANEECEQLERLGLHGKLDAVAQEPV